MAFLCVIIILTSYVHMLSSFYPMEPRFRVIDDLADTVMKMEHEEAMEEQKLVTMTDALNTTISEMKSEEKKASNEVSQLKKTMNGFTSQVPLTKASIIEISKGLEKLKSDLENIKTQKNKDIQHTGSVKSPSDTLRQMKKHKACPDDIGFHHVGGICLRLSDFADVRTWQESREECLKDGSDLITFRDAKEEKTVLSYLISIGENAFSTVRKSIQLWVGMKRQRGHYKWISDSTFPGNWIKFSPMDSDNYLCIAIRHGGLSDEICDSEKRFICQL